MKSPVVLITGASQGIGAAIARTFAAEVPGARLALVARNMKNLQAVARECLRVERVSYVASGSVVPNARASQRPRSSALGTMRSTSRSAAIEAYECDVANEESVRLMAAAVTERYGRVDVLINNAGAFEMAPFTETTTAMFDRQIAVNLRSAFLVTQAFLPGLLAQKRGDIFFLSSIAGLGAYPNAAAYCAAKFGVTGLAQVLRAETKDKGIRVCCVHPGATWTPSWAKSGVKPERIMPAADIARAILDVYRLSRRTVVEEIVLRPQLGDV